MTIHSNSNRSNKGYKYHKRQNTSNTIRESGENIPREISRSISVKGQTVIPKEYREYLGAQKGDELNWRVNEQGEVVVHVAHEPSIMRLKGVAKPNVPIKDMEEIIRQEKENEIRRKMDEGRL